MKYFHHHPSTDVFNFFILYPISLSYSLNVAIAASFSIIINLSFCLLLSPFPSTSRSQPFHLAICHYIFSACPIKCELIPTTSTSVSFICSPLSYSHELNVPPPSSLHYPFLSCLHTPPLRPKCHPHIPKLMFALHAQLSI